MTIKLSMITSTRSPRLRASWKASHVAATIAATYAIPYQRISSGPRARATGLGVKSIMVGTVYRAARSGSRAGHGPYTDPAPGCSHRRRTRTRAPRVRLTDMNSPREGPEMPFYFFFGLLGLVIGGLVTWFFIAGLRPSEENPEPGTTPSNNRHEQP